MHWIDARINEHEEREEHRQRIRAELPNLFAALWGAILADLDHAANNTTRMGALKIGTDGSLAQAKMMVWKSGTPGRKEVHIDIGDDGSHIFVYGETQLIFLVRICPDDSVCLMDQAGKSIEVAEGARRILDPLLFPELQKPEFPNSPAK
jgi:hypothetical protein